MKRPLNRILNIPITSWDEGIKYLELVKEVGTLEDLTWIFNKMHRLAVALELDNPEDQKKVLEIYKLVKDTLHDLSLETLAKLFSSTYLGNLIWLLHFATSIEVIDEQNMHEVLLIRDLEYVEDILLNDHLVGYLLDDSKKICLSINKDNLNKYSKGFLKQIHDSLFVLFIMELLKKDKDLVMSFISFYERGVYKKHYRWAKLLYSEDSVTVKDVLQLYRSITGEENVNLEESLVDLYYVLRENRFPVYFEKSLIRYNGVIYNGNFFPIIYKDRTGKTQVLGPFKQADINKVQKIYDFYSGSWIIPKERYGKILPEDIYSFREMSRISTEDVEMYIEKVRSMSEDDIELRLRKIIKDYGQTAHTPIEKADYLTFRLKINNDEDLRDAGIIIKGKSFKRQVTSKDITHQIVKVVKDNNLDLVIIITLYPLADDARDDLVNLCNKFNKMYTIMTALDLARLFVAYDVL